MDPRVLERPLPADWSVDRGLDAYLAENGFDRRCYDDKWTKASFAGVAFSIPNTERHRFGLMRHDLHHVVTGYGTDLAGEAEISAWEARRGFGDIGLYTSSIVVSILAWGIFAWPVRITRAASASGRLNLFQERIPYAPLLGWSIGALREFLGVPAEGLAGPRRLHSHAPREHLAVQPSR